VVRKQAVDEAIRAASTRCQARSLIHAPKNWSREQEVQEFLQRAVTYCSKYSPCRRRLGPGDSSLCHRHHEFQLPLHAVSSQHQRRPGARHWFYRVPVRLGGRADVQRTAQFCVPYDLWARHARRNGQGGLLFRRFTANGTTPRSDAEVIVKFISSSNSSDTITFNFIEPDSFWAAFGTQTFPSNSLSPPNGVGASFSIGGTDPGCSDCQLTTSQAAPEPAFLC
jgi:hypothetical protein